jgi:hypothetical protein
MSGRHRETSWSIEPAPWSLTADEECVTLEPPSADAALQFSSARKLDGAVTEDDLRDQAGKVEGALAVPLSVSVGRFRGFTMRRVADDATHWQYWWLANASLLLFVTYNAATEGTLTRDAPTVEYILGSLQAESDALAS